MRKVCLLLCICLFALTGCSKDDSKDLLETIKDRKYITIATEGMWRPFTYHNENDELVGYDVEIGRLIAEKLGVEARFNETDFDACIASVEAARSDIMINGVGITAERQAKFNFTNPYLYVHTALIVRKDDTSITTFEDLKGKKTANTLNSTYAALAESYGASVSPVDDFTATIELLLRGDIDATLNDETTFADYLIDKPDANVKQVASTIESEPYGICMNKNGSDSLLKEINKILDELRADGTLGKLSIKYFGSDITSIN